MKHGRRIELPEPLGVARERASHGLRRLPRLLRELDERASYPVRIAPALQSLVEATDRELESRG
jgi:nicotinate phosphoribosyltransferase